LSSVSGGLLLSGWHGVDQHLRWQIIMIFAARRLHAQR
jgi:hypothetical protein